LKVDIRLDIDSCPLSTDQLTLIGLLVVEAATNAAKHVFAVGRGSVFSICLAPLAGAKLRLAITDDGPGFGPPGQATNRLGMAIMPSLAQQLGGALEAVDGPGTTLRVDFPKEGVPF
jgi:two-component sensor histidine kinase